VKPATTRLIGGGLLAVPLAVWPAALAAQPPQKQIEYVHVDAAGSIRVVTDQAGREIERRDYLPFGEEWCGSATCRSVRPGFPARFTAKERDPETELDYFGGRYYGAERGRFTSVDPAYTIKENILDPQRWNRYAYGRNNPLRFVDPDGKDILVIENGPTQGNPIGHTAIALTGQGIYSFGNTTPAGSSPTEYLLDQAKRRDTTIFYLKTTPGQDAAALKYLQSFGGTDINPSDSVKKGKAKEALEKLYAVGGDNCATRVNGALDAAGIPPLVYTNNSALWNPGVPYSWSGSGMPGSAGVRVAGQGATATPIPKGSTTLPSVVKKFEPRPEDRPVGWP
jgi:RHS repeat-associated protein